MSDTNDKLNWILDCEMKNKKIDKQTAIKIATEKLNEIKKNDTLRIELENCTNFLYDTTQKLKSTISHSIAQQFFSAKHADEVRDVTETISRICTRFDNIKNNHTVE